jgi:hypothetical protein
VNKEMPELFDEMIEKIFAISCNLIKQGRKFNVEWFDKKLEDFDYREINNSDELLETIIDLYYSIPEEINGSTYDMYRKINGEIKGTVLYLCDRNIKVAEGNEIDIETDKVVLICLS